MGGEVSSGSKQQASQHAAANAKRRRPSGAAATAGRSRMAPPAPKFKVRSVRLCWQCDRHSGPLQWAQVL